MNEERIDAYLRGLDDEDAAADWTPEGGYAPSFDEWNAKRIAGGQIPGTFTEYLQFIERGDDVQQGC